MSRCILSSGVISESQLRQIASNAEREESGGYSHPLHVYNSNSGREPILVGRVRNVHVESDVDIFSGTPHLSLCADFVISDPETIRDLLGSMYAISPEVSDLNANPRLQSVALCPCPG